MANAAKKTNDALNKAHSFFNKELFKGKLPDAAIILARKKGSYGYYRHNRFTTGEGTLIDEIGINPDYISSLNDYGVAQTLVLAMISQWQATEGQKKGRDSYFNSEWAKKAISLGFHPQDPKKMTGQKVDYYATPDGAFATAIEKLSPSDLASISSSVEEPKKQSEAKKKVKHTCPTCGQNAWGQKDSLFICGLCYVKRSEVYEMQQGIKFEYRQDEKEE